MNNRVKALATAGIIAGGLYAVSDQIYAEEAETEEVVEQAEVEEVAEQPEVATQEVVEEATEEEATEEEATISLFEAGAQSAGVTLDETTFPDSEIREYIRNTYDTDGDGSLSNEEMTVATVVTANNVSDLTGLELLTNLQSLTLTQTNITNLDVTKLTSLQNLDLDRNPNLVSVDARNLKNLVRVEYGANTANLKTLDFRGCDNLEIAWHSANSETVYISAGMTKFIGCPAIKEHTGNIVIDLDGYYTTNADGTKTADLSKVVSQTLLSVLAQEDNPNYDPDTYTLTIPATEQVTTVTAGRDDRMNKTTWTFYTQLNQVDDVTVRFETNGGTLVESQLIEKGTNATEPTNPTKDGYTFLGWYTDEALTTEYDFSTSVNEDITLYAKWIEVIIEDNEEPAKGDEDPVVVEEVKQEEKKVEPVTVVENNNTATATNASLFSLMGVSAAAVFGFLFKKRND